jgi:cobalt-zinc-cadmium efflux system outer membrane protein
MVARRLLPFLVLLLGSGCLYQVRERTEGVASALATQEFDRVQSATPTGDRDRATRPTAPDGPDGKGKVKQALPDVDVNTVSFLQKKDGPGVTDIVPPKLEVPRRIPGSEAKLIRLPKDPAEKAAEVRRLYRPLAALPDYPRGQPGPEGRAYTLADLHRMAMANSPTVRQALAAVEVARGNMIQASMYPNPTIGPEFDPTNNNAVAGVYGVFIDQVIKTGGKLKLATAAAIMDLANAELALKRARSDLATSVRSNYFSFIVSLEAVQVTRALAQFTDEIYRLQANLLPAGVAAAYEPASMRAQANMARIAYRQAIEAYVMNWKQLAAAVGDRDLPLSQVVGQVDQLIPRYDYNRLLAHVLQNHTDVLIARNGIDKQRYNLKFAQVTPVPDLDVHFMIQKELIQTPFTWLATLNIGIPLPIWDQNKGGIMAAEAALAQAIQEPKRVELVLTNGVANAFSNYSIALEAVETYRRDILPDFVRAYLGVYERRRIDPAVAFSDLLGAQQNLAGGVTSYLTALGSLWTAVVALVDFAQVDDLFELGKAGSLPPLVGLTGPVPAVPTLPVPKALPPAESIMAPLPPLSAMGSLPPGSASPDGLPGRRDTGVLLPPLQTTATTGMK